MGDERTSKKIVAEKKLAKALAAKKQQAALLHALDPSDVTYKAQSKIYNRLKAFCEQYETEIKTIKHPPKQSEKKTFPTRVARQAEALTAELSEVQNKINTLDKTINTDYKKAQAVLSGTLPKEATPQEPKTLKNNFEALNTKIENKLQKEANNEYLRFWKPIYNLFREIFGQERELTTLKRQQSIAHPIFTRIEKAVTEKLKLEEKQTTLEEGLKHTIQEQGKFKTTTSSIQEALKAHQLGKTMRKFVSPLKESVALVAKALNRFVTEPNEEKRHALSQAMKDNPQYTQGPEAFLSAIDEARELYEEVDQADKPARTSSSKFKKDLSNIKQDESSEPNPNERKQT